jgi:hypothetical protein
LFDPQTFVSGDLIDDFSKAIGLTNSSDMARPPRTNESLSPEAQSFLLAFNRLMPRFDENFRPNPRVDLDQAMTQLFPGTGRRPARADAIAFCNHFAEGNDIIRREFFPERPALFDDDFNEYPAQADDVELSTEKAIEIAVALWKYQAELRTRK